MRFDDADRAENCTGRVRFAEKRARQSGGRLLTSRNRIVSQNVLSWGKHASSRRDK